MKNELMILGMVSIVAIAGIFALSIYSQGNFAGGAIRLADTKADALQISNKELTPVPLPNTPSVKIFVKRLFSMNDVNDHSPVQGVTLSLDGKTAQTMYDGSATIYIGTKGDKRITATHDAYYTREMNFNIPESWDFRKQGPYPLEVTMVTKEFPMAFYDYIVRFEGYDGSYRWLTQPTWIIDPSAAVGSGIVPTEAQKTFVKNIIQSELTTLTGTFVNNPSITIAPASHTPTPGVFLMYWDDSIGGSGASSFVTDGYEIMSGIVKIKTTTSLAGKYRYYLIRPFGFTQSVTNAYSPSIFNTPTPTNYQNIDVLMGTFLYKRPPNHRTPDSDYYYDGAPRGESEPEMLTLKVFNDAGVISESFPVDPEKTWQIFAISNEEIRSFYGLTPGTNLYYNSETKHFQISTELPQ